MNNYLGIDIGGTDIKAALIEENGHQLIFTKIPTDADGTVETIIKKVSSIAALLIEQSGVSPSSIKRAGVGIPGLIKNSKGPVVFAPNIGWTMIDAVPLLEKALQVPVILGNDALCMAMAESKFGTGRNYRNIILLTLGTAVGGAVIFDGKPFNGFGPYGGEIGHIPLYHGGYPCSCGLKGCFEQYGSANALVWQTLSLMKDNPETALWHLWNNNRENFTSEIIIEAASQGDLLAIQALDQFTTYVAEGIAGLVNIFRPDAVVLGGGLTNAGSILLDPINEKLPHFTYASEFTGTPPVLRTEVGSKAGAIGAALLSID